MPQILVSIIIPVFNQEKLVVKALDSIPKRDDLEIIVIDDGSTDETYKSVKNYQKEHQGMNLRLLRHSKNKGVGAAKNRGLKYCSGEYIAVVDSDDYVYTDKYNQIIDMLGEYDIYYMNLKTNNGEFVLSVKSKYMLCGNPCKIIRRSLIGDSRFREDIEAGEDYYFNLEIQAKEHSEIYTNIFAYHYNYPRENSLWDRLKKGEIKG